MRRVEIGLLVAVVSVLGAGLVSLVTVDDDEPRTAGPVPTASSSPSAFPTPHGSTPPPALAVTGPSMTTYAPGSGKLAVRLPLTLTGTSGTPVSARLGSQPMTLTGSEVTGTLLLDCAAPPEALDLQVLLDDGTALSTRVPVAAAAVARACARPVPVTAPTGAPVPK